MQLICGFTRAFNGLGGGGRGVLLLSLPPPHLGRDVLIVRDQERKSTINRCYGVQSSTINPQNVDNWVKEGECTSARDRET